MPFIKKSDLENMLRSAFGTGFWSALSVDHEEDSLHIRQEEDFQKFYEEWLRRK
ncbi:hypothetical protein [Paenibacillus sp. IHBB 3054]|uniref:hypothetical protein n=1 Tax=Paenibacillus sp. IHBB 3054 TaxID=3425689 RepID=UPI003F661BD1